MELQSVHCQLLASFTAAVQDDLGWSPLDRVLESINLAEEAHSAEFNVALYLLDHDCGGDKERAKLLSKACFWGELDTVKELVEQHKVDPNSECCWVCQVI